MEKTVKIIELDPKKKGVSEWPHPVLGLSKPHRDVPLRERSGVSMGQKKSRCGAGHLGGWGRSCYGSMGQGTFYLELGHLNGEGTS